MPAGTGFRRHVRNRRDTPSRRQSWQCIHTSHGGRHRTDRPSSGLRLRTTANPLKPGRRRRQRQFRSAHLRRRRRPSCPSEHLSRRQHLRRQPQRRQKDARRQLSARPIDDLCRVPACLHACIPQQGIRRPKTVGPLRHADLVKTVLVRVRPGRRTDAPGNPARHGRSGRVPHRRCYAACLHR